MQSWYLDMKEDFILNFIDQDRWKFLTTGLKNTLIITFWALLLGILLGVIVAIIRASYDKTAPTMRKGIKKFIFWLVNGVCKIYLTVIRGTPVVVQLMIMYYIIFATSRNSIMVAVLAFGINSGAYVAEIVRSGIMSVDAGQFEAGRSLGFNYIQTMWYIVFPQAFKNILPALGNEFIVLIKETSVAGYVALKDITYVGNLIRSRTYEAFFPLITVAAIYLAIVMILSYFLKKLERRLRSSDH